MVDDEEDMRYMLKAALGGKYEVLEAHDGLDALDKLERYEPDFVIMDVSMPLMNGLDASEAIRNNPGFNHIPILFLSGLSNKETMQKAYRSGADLFLTKPIQPEHILNAVDSVLEKQSRSPREKKYSVEEIRKMESGEEAPPAEKSEKKESGAVEKPSEAIKTGEVKKRSPYHKAHKPRVMIVDDDIDMINFLRMTLSDDYETVAAQDGLDAVRKLVIYQPDIFLLDIMMPKMSGYQLLQSLRRNTTYRNSPIMIVSAKSSRKDINYAQRMGADAYLPKPFNAKDLLQKLMEIIRKRRMVIRAKKYSLEQIEQLEQEEEQKFDSKDEKHLRKKEENEIQRMLREEMNQ